MWTRVKIFGAVAMLVTALTAIIWGQGQARARDRAENERDEASRAVAELNLALTRQQEQHERWVLAAQEREERLRQEIEGYESIVCEVEEVKKTDQTAADFGSSLYHPAYLERLRRNAP